ncbi:MAG TPA: hypothetical protein VFU56_01305 [Gaiellaceae bacterium]|nr:hypothetical protein [Gaiellaceae bacterium]
MIRSLVVAAALASAAAVPAGSTAAGGSVVSFAGVSVRVPPGWHGAAAPTPSCDPERLIAVSSAPLRPFEGHRGFALPRHPGDVLVFVLEVQMREDRPVGNLRRPRHFAVDWTHLRRLEPCCEAPTAPAYLRYVRQQGRYIGFIVYPIGRVGPATRAATERLVDSLTIRPR